MAVMPCATNATAKHTLTICRLAAHTVSKPFVESVRSSNVTAMPMTLATDARTAAMPTTDTQNSTVRPTAGRANVSTRAFPRTKPRMRIAMHML